MNRILCCWLWTLAIGCSSKGGLVVVKVDAMPALTGVAKLHATAMAGGTTHAYDFIPSATTLPPAFDFALEIPPSISGTFSISVDAFDSGMVKLGSADANKPLMSGSSIEIDVQLVGPGGSDGGGSGTGMVDVPAGGFVMGCNNAIDGNCSADEGAARTVMLPAFSIDMTEVTQAAYQACVAASSCTKPAGNFDPINQATLPVTNIQWYQATAFCKWAGRRLPSEAEWERAARGADGRVYPWGADAPTCMLANFAGCGGMVKAVGSLLSGQSPSGALDMAANVWEWVNDWYDPNYYLSSPLSNPQGPATGSERVIRGGGFDAGSVARFVRTSARSHGDPAGAGAGDSQGFRCAK